MFARFAKNSPRFTHPWRTLQTGRTSHSTVYRLADKRRETGILRKLAAVFVPSLNLHQIVLGHHEFLSHFKAFPFFFPGLDLPRIERPRVQMVFLLFLLIKRKHADAFMVDHQSSHRCNLVLLNVCLTRCLRFSFMMSLVSCSIFSFHRSKK